jgi:hypothetical protein
MSEETETPDPKAFDRFRRLAKKVVSVPKSEIDKRAKEWREAREAEKTFRRRDVRLQSRSFACENPMLRRSPNSNRLLLRLSAMISQYFTRYTARLLLFAGQSQKWEHQHQKFCWPKNQKPGEFPLFAGMRALDSGL